MPDWGMLSSGVSSLHGITRSPWDEALTTGGSSSGAGAAAAAGYGPLHVGTDIGGSIRLPGTWLGLTTLKPSAGRVPLDTPYLGRVAGPMTRSRRRRGAAAVGHQPPRPPRLDEPAARGPAPDAATASTRRPAAHRSATSTPGAGCPSSRTCAPRSRPPPPSSPAPAPTVEPLAPFMAPGWLEDLDEFWRVRSLVDLEALDPEAASGCCPSSGGGSRAAARRRRARVLRDYASIMAIQQATVAATEPFDLVLSPVAPMTAFPAEWPMPWGEGDEAMSHIGFTAPYNMSGQPAGTTNCGFTADGRTIGLQVSGRRFDDLGVLRALAWFEATGPRQTPRWPIRIGSDCHPRHGRTRPRPVGLVHGRMRDPVCRRQGVQPVSVQVKVPSIERRIAEELGVRDGQVAAAVGLLDGGSTVPFVARYRKEVTGGLDDTQLRTLEERLGYLRELEERRAAVLASVEEQGKLDDALRAQILAAETKARLEDIYLPFKPKRRTKAQIAREAGLEPLADLLLGRPDTEPATAAAGFVDADREVADAAAALDGARAILVERFAEDADLIGDLRERVWKQGHVGSRVRSGKEEEGAKFSDYFDFAEPLAKLPSHRILALFRGEKEDVLALEIDPDDPAAEQPPGPHGIRARHRARASASTNTGPPGRPVARRHRALGLAHEDPRAPRHRRRGCSCASAAEEEAVRVFAANLRDLLLAAPAGARATMGLDPGFRTGVKVAVVDGTGKRRRDRGRSTRTSRSTSGTARSPRWRAWPRSTPSS